MPPTRRTVLAGLASMASLAALPTLAACGGPPEADPADEQDGSGATPDASAFPVTIEHKYGETTIEGPAQRIVCLGYTDQDTLLALGIVPVGVAYWFGDEALNGIYPWARDALGDAEEPTLIDIVDGVPREQVAGLAPDLIIAQYSGLTQQEYDSLSDLAPVVAQSGDYADYSVPWQEASVRIGTAVGLADEAQTLVDDAQGQIEQVATDHPEFAGQTATVVTPFEGLFLYGPEDPRLRMLTDFGFELPPILADADDNEFGISVSAERTTELGDVGVTVWLDLQADKQIATLYEQTAGYEQGRYLDITEADGNYYVAHSFVTPLSIPYLLERYVPQLAAAADGDPATELPEVETD